MKNTILTRIINESIKKVLKEFKNNNNYSHFAINKNTNKIINGWDYNGYDSTELRSDKNYYFIDDLKDILPEDVSLKDYIILSDKSCRKKGIDPDDNNNWSNL